MSKPKILCMFGLSGSGKSTVEQVLMEKKDFKKVVSCATRPIRNGEKEGLDYYFVSEEFFDEIIKNKGFEEIGGKYGGRYGVLKSEIVDDKINILVTAKDGMDELRELDKYDMINIWFDCDVTERFVRIGKRNNLEYSLKRIEKDGFRRGEEIGIADYIIDTTDLSQAEMVLSVINILLAEEWIDE